MNNIEWENKLKTSVQSLSHAMYTIKQMLSFIRNLLFCTQHFHSTTRSLSNCVT